MLESGGQETSGTALISFPLALSGESSRMTRFVRLRREVSIIADSTFFSLRTFFFNPIRVFFPVSSRFSFGRHSIIGAVVCSNSSLTSGIPVLPGSNRSSNRLRKSFCAFSMNSFNSLFEIPSGTLSQDQLLSKLIPNWCKDFEVVESSPMCVLHLYFTNLSFSSFPTLVSAFTLEIKFVEFAIFDKFTLQYLLFKSVELVLRGLLSGQWARWKLIGQEKAKLARNQLDRHKVDAAFHKNGALLWPFHIRW